MNSADPSLLRIQAIVVMDLLESRPPSHSLPTADFVKATVLASSLKQGLSAKVLALSAAFEAPLLIPERLAAAYGILCEKEMGFSERLKDLLHQRACCLQGAPCGSVLNTEEALALVLLDLARSQTAVGGHAPQLEPALLHELCLVAGAVSPLLKRVVFFHKAHILPNPAAWIAERGVPVVAPFLPSEAERPMLLAVSAPEPTPLRGPVRLRSEIPLRSPGKYAAAPVSPSDPAFKTPEWKRLLGALRQGDALGDVLQCALPASLRAELTQERLNQLYTAFFLYSEQGFEAIRTHYLAELVGPEREVGSELLAHLERTCYRLAAWFKQDVRLGLSMALQRLAVEQAAVLNRNPEHRTPFPHAGAAAYARYRQQA